MRMINVERDSSGAVLSILMLRPSNFHAHFRDGIMRDAVAYAIMRWVKYVLAMPNTGPIDDVESVIRYYNELVAIRDSFGLKTEFIMTIYLTRKLTWKMVEELAKLPFKVEVKYYPPHPGATTGSGLGIPLDAVPKETWEAMADHNIPLLGHFESVEDKRGRILPMEDRETYFMKHEFARLLDHAPETLRISIEHGSTSDAIDWVKQGTSGRLVIGFTPHHLLISIDDLMQKSWRNHGRCMPIPKGPEHVASCLEFATSGDSRAILGDDTAPHPSLAKEGEFDTAACGCYLPHALAMYAFAFEQAGALDQRFVNFASLNGVRWRGLAEPSKDDMVKLVATDEDVPEPTKLGDGSDVVIPLGWTKEPDKLKLGLALAIEEHLAT